MAASFPSKDSAVLGQQLKVQELCLRKDNPLVTVSGSDLVIDVKESVSSVLHCAEQVAAGTITGRATTISGSEITIVAPDLTATTTFVIKYVIAE